MENKSSQVSNIIKRKGFVATARFDSWKDDLQTVVNSASSPFFFWRIKICKVDMSPLATEEKDKGKKWLERKHDFLNGRTTFKTYD